MTDGIITTSGEFAVLAADASGNVVSRGPPGKPYALPQWQTQRGNLPQKRVEFRPLASHVLIFLHGDPRIFHL